MRVFTARVHDGAIVADDVDALVEGEIVTVVVEEEGEFDLGDADLAAVEVGIEAADRGDVVPLNDVLDELARV